MNECPYLEGLLCKECHPNRYAYCCVKLAKEYKDGSKLLIGPKDLL